MECEHPLKFWAVYRGLMTGSQKRGFYYRCPACRRKLNMDVSRTHRVLSSVIVFASSLLVLFGTFLLGLVERLGILLAALAMLVPGYVLCFSLLMLVCWIGFRFGFYELDGYAWEKMA